VIYEFLYPLSANESLSFLNVLRYVPFRAVMALLTAMLITFSLYPWFIRRLQTKQVGQVVRKEGLASHLSKAGTPTMGGSLILLSLCTSTVLWADPQNTFVWVVMAITAGYGAIGYIDDAAKIRRKSSGGLAGRYKLLLQFGLAIGVCAWLYYGDSGLPAEWTSQVYSSEGEPLGILRYRLALPFVSFNKHPIELPAWLYVAFAAFVIASMSNAVNLTDGLDGLAIGPVMINAGAYLVLAYLAGVVLFEEDVASYLDIPSIASATELTIYCGALLGAGFGFLWYNTYPAQVFMGDVGSLALGGGLGALAVTTKNEFLSVILGGIFVVEAVSVVIQVAVFKITGKRVFLMAPIHHHFEKKGWPEPRVIVRFWIISVMLALVAFAQLKIR
jgi:phospho-N-acetylmuramoyl-pentapeptide-transferase